MVDADRKCSYFILTRYQSGLYWDNNPNQHNTNQPTFLKWGKNLDLNYTDNKGT